MSFECASVKNYTNDDDVDIIIDTIMNDKQILVFVNSKKNAESLTTKIAKFHALYEDKIVKDELNKLSEEILNVLETPTEQCQKLANVVKHGIAFHHSGLLAKQRTLIEEGFRNKFLKVIVATPTLAAGINLPAFRVFIRHLYRYSNYMKPISVMEFHQMAGRAGRPGLEEFGEVIAYGDFDTVFENYVYAPLEPITSKFGVETTLRTIVLGLATRFNSLEKIMNFLKKTFYAYQYQDLEQLKMKVYNILELLNSLEFIVIKKSNNALGLFQSAYDLDVKFDVTELGYRVNELYIDPLSASKIISFLRLNKKDVNRYLFTLSSTSEMHPLFSVSKKESEEIFDFLFSLDLFPDEDNLRIGKLSLVLLKWINEIDEKELLELHSIRPGEFRSKLQIMEWLSYSSVELAKIINPNLTDWLKELDLRLKYGVSHDLLNLVTIKNIGRKRARLLYNHGIKNINDLLNKSSTARKLLGKRYDSIIKQFLKKNLSN